MKKYIDNIIPKITAFSKTLDALTLIEDMTWKVISDEQIEQKLIFKRGGKLIHSEKGNVTIGSWELLNKAQSILIEFNGKIKLYNHGFFDEVVLILRVDGLNDYFILANENKIGSKEIENYLESLYLNQDSKQPRQIASIGEEIVKTNYGNVCIKFRTTINTPTKGDEVSINGLPIQDGRYKLGTMFYIYCQNGKIERTSIF